MKLKLLATTAVVAGMLMASAPAHAFGWGYGNGNGNGTDPDADPDIVADADESFWSWDKTISENVDIAVTITSDLLPEGHVEIDKTQTFNGDVTADVEFSGDYLTDDVDAEPLAVANTNAAAPQASSFCGWWCHDDDPDPDTDPDADPDLDPTADAVSDLGTLQGDATAIANFQELQTETATFLRDSQIHNALNENGFGVEATANAGTMDNPVEAAVDLSATAISNYMSMESAPTGLNDNVLIADISQETDANVHASATTFQDLTGYSGTAGFTGVDIDQPGVVGRLNATAIGNFASIKFGPSVVLGDELGE